MPTARSPQHGLLYLLGSPGDTSLGKVVNGDLDGHLITGQYPNIVDPELARYVRGHYMTVVQLYFEGSVGQSLDHSTLKFHYIVLSQNDPSKLYDSLKTDLCKKQDTDAQQTFVRSTGPSSVIATECS